MFCSECGKEATGKFCWNCGAQLHAGAASQPAAVAATAPPTAVADWRNEIDYQALLANPEVRDILARQRPAESHLTGEEFLDAFGKIVKSPVSLAPVATVLQEVSGRLGIHTGKTRAETYQGPAGPAIVAALCVLARDGYKVKEARQASDGCVLVCEIPSDMFSMAGQLVVTFQRGPEGVSVSADTRIEGQMFDWGKSQRCLRNLFDGIAAGA